jgi:3-deoxy-manno-octulosonate cytidylyltransferase (CMP-KDO synthetase)
VGAILTPRDCKSGTDRVLVAAESLGLEDDDMVVNVQGDEPFINPDHIDTLVSGMLHKECIKGRAFRPPAGMGTLATVERDGCQDPNVVKVVMDIHQNALYFSRSLIPFPRNQVASATENEFFRHIGVYAFRADTLKELPSLEPIELEKVESLEQLRWLYYGYNIRVVQTTIETPNIDTPEDVEKVLKNL